MITDTLTLFRRLGIRRTLALLRGHRMALSYYRGYITTQCLWALMGEGLLTRLELGERLQLGTYCEERGLDASVLRAVCAYLDGLGLVRLKADEVRLTRRGRAVARIGRGNFELVRAYNPVLKALPALLSRTHAYGTDISRDMRFHNLGFGHLGRQLPFHIVGRMLRQAHAASVLDLRCGYGDFLRFVCEGNSIAGFGVDEDETFLEVARESFARTSLNGQVKLAALSPFDGPALAQFAGDVDAIVSLDILHEHVWHSREKVSGLLSGLREAFPQSILLVGEYCGNSRPLPLAKPNGFLEHELYHALSHQRFLRVDEWREVFQSVGYEIATQQTFATIGLTYFALSPGGGQTQRT